MAYAYDWIDAFTDLPFAGNACAVVYGADDIPVERRVALVRETSLSECAYLVASDRADFGVRYYLATREIPMAGHPTIATVVSLIHRGFVTPTPAGTEFTLEVGAGVLPISVIARPGRAPLVEITQQQPCFGAVQDPAEIASLYGLDASDIIDTPQIVSAGTPFCITLLSGHEALRRAVLNAQELEAWRQTLDEEAAPIMEPFLVALGGAEPGGDTFSRLLLVPPSPAEDPFTGSATGCMAAYLFVRGHVGSRFVAQQGNWLGRPGSAEVQLLGSRDNIEGVKVGGSGVVLMSGSLLI
ncbi:MAG: PhzF family phenazine biosynthesis protein [Pseudomonadota bacterium]